MSFGAFVRAMRVEKGLTVTECASRGGVTQSRWTRIEDISGDEQPRRKTIEMISEVLQIPIETVSAEAYPSGKVESDHNPELVKIGRRIATARAQMGLTQAEFATTIGIPRSSLASWEQGAAEPGVLAMVKIARALRVPVERLLDDSAKSDEMLYDALPATMRDIKDMASNIEKLNDTVGKLLHRDRILA